MILKVYGMKDPANIADLQAVQPDWMGMIFYSKSPRFVDLQINTQSINSKRIGVFVNAPQSEIEAKIIDYKLDGIQLHGQESPDFCQRFLDKDIIVIKAFAIGTSFDFNDIIPYEGTCNYYLFDTYGKTPGGTGKTFNWEILDHYNLQTPFLLSGGIGPDSVAALRAFNHPKWVGVDINSRFEKEPGIKNIQKVQHFKDELFGK